ncbi:MAG: DUF547 domain-containing protein [Thermoanaerobaculia bacterium]|nr:DUF547 domain-containing protein [Thermoanaerobaculia bacterium]
MSSIPSLLAAGLLAAVTFAPTPAVAGTPATEAWNRTLQKHGHKGGLDYAALAKDRADLDTFLASLATVDVAKLPKAEQLAFWINAYNAVTAHHVLARYPAVRSVKDEAGFFDKLKYRVAGADRSLDEIETAGRQLGDARIHFAVVCASTSCPDLLPEAFVPAKLEAQLAGQTRAFLSDPTKGLKLSADGSSVGLSSIFKWYAGDFTGGSTVAAFFARGGVLDWVIAHAPEGTKAKLEAKKPSVTYLDYDWSLNDRKK